MNSFLACYILFAVAVKSIGGQDVGEGLLPVPGFNVRVVGTTVVSISASVVPPGDTVTFSCQVTNQTVRDVVLWKRKQGEKITNIGSNIYLEKPFRDTGRYFLSYVNHSDANSIQDGTYTLTINDTRLEDAGLIGCQLAPGGQLSNLSLDVVVPVQKLQIFIVDSSGTVTFYEDGESITLPIETPLSLGCRAADGAPMPDVRLDLAGHDVTHMLNASHTVTVLDDEVANAGLVRRVHTVVLNNTEGANVTFTPTPHDATLTCQASLPLNANNVTTVNILHKPYVACSSAKAVMYKRYVELGCNVTAHPPESFVEWSWTEKSGEIRKLRHTPAAKRRVTKQLYTSIFSAPGQYTLQIERAYPQTFRAYSLSASVDNFPVSSAVAYLYMEYQGDSSAHVMASPLLVGYMCIQALVYQARL